MLEVLLLPAAVDPVAVGCSAWVDPASVGAVLVEGLLAAGILAAEAVLALGPVLVVLRPTLPVLGLGLNSQLEVLAGWDFILLAS